MKSTAFTERHIKIGSLSGPTAEEYLVVPTLSAYAVEYSEFTPAPNLDSGMAVLYQDTDYRIVGDRLYFRYAIPFVFGGVYPNAVRPHFLIRSGPKAGTYVRVGSTNRRADADLIAEMQRFARGEVYDERPMPDLDSEAIDFRVASESFAGVRKLRRRDLETLRILANHQGHQVPTVGGCYCLAGTA